ncbi:putative HD superfamily hydrolase domain protein, partial [Escherichia coli EC1865]
RGAATDGRRTFYDISSHHHDRPGSRQPCADVPRDLLTG